MTTTKSDYHENEEGNSSLISNDDFKISKNYTKNAITQSPKQNETKLPETPIKEVSESTSWDFGSFGFFKSKAPKEKSKSEIKEEPSIEQQRAARAARALKREKQKLAKVKQNSFEKRKSYTPGNEKVDTTGSPQRNNLNGNNIIKTRPQTARTHSNKNTKQPVRPNTARSVSKSDNMKTSANYQKTTFMIPTSRSIHYGDSTDLPKRLARLSLYGNVGTSPSPNVKAVKSSLSIYARENLHRKPAGGEVQIYNEKSRYKKIGSRIGSLENCHYKPTGGDITILNNRVRYIKKSKCGSLDNVSYSPKPSSVKIVNNRLSICSQSKIGSLDNASYKPKQSSIAIRNNKQKLKNISSKLGSLNNSAHQAGGGNIKIFSQKLNYKNIKSKTGSMDNVKHKAGGGDVIIYDENNAVIKNLIGIDGRFKAKESLEMARR